MKTLEEMSYIHMIEQLREEVRKLTDENKLLCESIKRYLHEKKKIKSHLVAVIAFHLQKKMFSVEVFAAIKKKAQFVGNGVININTDNYGNRRKTS